MQMMQLSTRDLPVLIPQWQIRFQPEKGFNFDDSRSVSDDECRVLTSLRNVQFEDLVTGILESGIQNFSNRST